MRHCRLQWSIIWWFWTNSFSICRNIIRSLTVKFSFHRHFSNCQCTYFLTEKSWNKGIFQNKTSVILKQIILLIGTQWNSVWVSWKMLNDQPPLYRNQGQTMFSLRFKRCMSTCPKMQTYYCVWNILAVSKPFNMFCIYVNIQFWHGWITFKMPLIFIM